MDKAVERCITEGILKDYLLKKRAEAVSMFLTEFDEKAWEKTIREEEQEEALEEERQNTERERQRAERESQKAEMEHRNAERERQRAERAEARIAELEAQLNAK